MKIKTRVNKLPTQFGRKQLQSNWGWLSPTGSPAAGRRGCKYLISIYANKKEMKNEFQRGDTTGQLAVKTPPQRKRALAGPGCTFIGEALLADHEAAEVRPDRAHLELGCGSWYVWCSCLFFACSCVALLLLVIFRPGASPLGAPPVLGPQCLGHVKKVAKGSRFWKRLLSYLVHVNKVAKANMSDFVAFDGSAFDGSASVSTVGIKNYECIDINGENFLCLWYQIREYSRRSLYNSL